MAPRTTTERQKIRDEHPDSWVAVNEADTIFGKITDVTDAWSNQKRNPETGRPGAPYPLLTILAQDATGYSDLPKELKLHCFGAVLFNEIMRKQPGIGEQIRVTYKGTGEAKEGQNPPELYTVRCGDDGSAAQRAYGAIGSGPKHGGASQGEQQQLPDDDIPF